MSDLTGLINDLQRKLKEKDIRIKRLESMLESAGAKASDVINQAQGQQEILALQQKVEELQGQLLEMKKELSQEKQKLTTQNEEYRKNSNQMADLVKELQLKLHKRDETIARLEGTKIKLEEQVKSYQEELAKMRERPIPEVIKNLESEIKKRDELIAKLEEQIKEMSKPRLPTEQRWWY